MHSATAASIWRLLGARPFRMALVALAILTPAAAVFATFIGWQVNQLLAERTLEALRSELGALRIELDRGGVPALSTAVAARSSAPGRGLYRLAAGLNPPLPIGNLKDMPTGVTTTGSVFQIWSVADNRFHPAAGIVVPVPDGTLLVAQDIDDQRAFAAGLQRITFGGVGVLSALALGLGWLASRRASYRVAEITATTRSIMAGDLARRVPRDQSGDEFDHLAESLNAMLARIEDLMQALREVSDNIAHDLKTPLSRLRNRAEAALRDDHAPSHRDGLERIIEEADGLIQTFNSLLLIARLEASVIDGTRTDCDLANLVNDVAELYQPVADEAGLAMTIDVTQPAPLSVNQQLVGQAIANMIDNAVKYSAGTPNAAMGPITIGVVPRPNRTVEISVADRGPGIAPADRERATKRFVRLEQSRSRPGTGLGLSLVAAVARLHGGTVRLEDNGPGLRIVLVLSPPINSPETQPSPRATARTGHAAHLPG